MAEDAEFRGCDATTVFAEVTSGTDSEEAESLWSRLLEEMAKHRVDGAVGYLEAEFQRLTEILDRELKRLEDD